MKYRVTLCTNGDNSNLNYSILYNSRGVYDRDSGIVITFVRFTIITDARRAAFVRALNFFAIINSAK